MEITQEELENELHMRFAADQAAQLFEEGELVSHSEHPLSSSEGYREEIRDELMGILEERFENKEHVEFAYMLMMKAYALE